jgi:hypothetical protein
MENSTFRVEWAQLVDEDVWLLELRIDWFVGSLLLLEHWRTGTCLTRQGSARRNDYKSRWEGHSEDKET